MDQARLPTPRRLSRPRMLGSSPRRRHQPFLRRFPFARTVGWSQTRLLKAPSVSAKGQKELSGPETSPAL